MARFNATTYAPKQDSSPSVLPKGVDPTSTLILLRDEGRCSCGCNEQVNKGRTFKMGHDARLKGKLIRADLTGTKVVFARTNGKDFEATSPETAETVAKVFGWAKQIANGRKVAKAQAARAKAAKKAPAKAAPTQELTRGQKAAATRKANAAKKAAQKVDRTDDGPMDA